MKELLNLHGLVDKKPNTIPMIITGQDIVQGVLQGTLDRFDPVFIEENPFAGKQNFIVTNFGAVADGVTDCRAAIQAAVDAASAANACVFFPAAELPYKISNYITIKSNIIILGYGATIFRPSETTTSLLFYNATGTDVENVQFRGITLKSTNDKTGSGDTLGSLTSNIQGITISGVTNLLIKDVTMDAMLFGIKLDTSTTATYNNNVRIENLTITNSMTGIMANKTTGLVMLDSSIDNTGSATKFLHSLYIRGDTSNFHFCNCLFQNVSGGGIHIYAATGTAPNTIVFDNCFIDNALVGVYLYSACNNITFNNLEIFNSGVGIKANSANVITFSKLRMFDFANNKSEASGFYLTNLTNAQFNHVDIDAATLAGPIINLISGNLAITATNFNLTDGGGVNFTSASGPVVEMTAQNMNIGNSLTDHYDITGTFSGVVPDDPPYLLPELQGILIHPSDSILNFEGMAGAGYANQAGLYGETIEVIRLFR